MDIIGLLLVFYFAIGLGWHVWGWHPVGCLFGFGIGGFEVAGFLMGLQ